MAQPTVLAGTKLLILVGNGSSPEVFSEPCGLTTKSFDINSSTNTTLIPDCIDPELPAWEAKDVNALSATLTGSGVMAVESFDTWRLWAMNALARNVHIKLNSTLLGYFIGSFVLSSLKYGGERGQKITLDVTMVSNNALTWHQGA